MAAMAPHAWWNHGPAAAGVAAVQQQQPAWQQSSSAAVPITLQTVHGVASRCLSFIPAKRVGDPHRTKSVIRLAPHVVQGLMELSVLLGASRTQGRTQEAGRDRHQHDTEGNQVLPAPLSAVPASRSALRARGSWRSGACCAAGFTRADIMMACMIRVCLREGAREGARERVRESVSDCVCVHARVRMQMRVCIPCSPSRSCCADARLCVCVCVSLCVCVCKRCGSSCTCSMNLEHRFV